MCEKTCCNDIIVDRSKEVLSQFDGNLHQKKCQNLVRFLWMKKQLAELQASIKKVVLKPGEPGYLVSTKFLSEFENCAKKNIPLFTLDNSSLFKKETFAPNLVEGKDYIVVDQKLWDELQFNFEIKREARVRVMENCKVELYPLNIMAVYKTSTKTFLISRNLDVSSLVLRIVMEFGIPPEANFEVFPYGSTVPLNLEKGSIQEVLNGVFKIEIKPVVNKKKTEQKLKGIKTLYRNEDQVINDDNMEIKEKTKTQNVNRPAGIKNLGNTCYLNASLQCLASLPPFASRLDEIYALGTQAKIGRILANTIRDLSRINTVIDPSNFKSVFSESAPYFAGFEQQDAHEFTSVLIEQLRNECPKIVEETFIGQLHTSTTCADCGAVSEVDERFSSIALPLSGARRVLLVPFETTKPMMRLFKPPENMDGFMLVGEINGVLKEVEWPAPECNDVYALELPKHDIESKKPKGLCLVMLRTNDRRSISAPIIVEVPLKEKVTPSRLTGLISTRIGDLWQREARPEAQKNWRVRNAPDRFLEPSDGRICNVLTVEVKGKYAEPESGFLDTRTRPAATPASLPELIDGFLTPSRLDAANVWKCERCGKSTRAFKQSAIVSAPAVLIMQLKRFAVGQRVERDATVVELPPELQFGGAQYEFRAVINHTGGVDAGHYTAVAKRAEGSFFFNDSKVTPRALPDHSYSPYVLFYVRK